jgi:hypothetical protein
MCMLQTPFMKAPLPPPEDKQLKIRMMQEMQRTEAVHMEKMKKNAEIVKKISIKEAENAREQVMIMCVCVCVCGHLYIDTYIHRTDKGKRKRRYDMCACI